MLIHANATANANANAVLLNITIVITVAVIIIVLLLLLHNQIFAGQFSKAGDRLASAPASDDEDDGVGDGCNSRHVCVCDCVRECVWLAWLRAFVRPVLIIAGSHVMNLMQRESFWCCCWCVCSDCQGTMARLLGAGGRDPPSASTGSTASLRKIS